jgi:1-acyl-sn-glycerol-3-phosphate acyltransferase
MRTAAAQKSNRPSGKSTLACATVRADRSASPSSCFSGSRSWRSWLRLPWDIVAMVLGLFYWAVFGGLLTLIGGPLHLLLARRTGERLGRFLLHHLFRCFVVYLRITRLVRVDSAALGKLGALPGPAIIAPNHVSLWDVVFIIARLPRAVCVMKKSILGNPVLGGGARLAGYIANDGMGQMIRNAAATLTENAHLLLFPEGTRTRRDALWINPLKGGCAIIALRANVPVHPVFIRSDTRYLEKGWPLWKRPEFPIHIVIETGEPLVPAPDESSQAFTARLQAVFEQELSKPHPLRRKSVMPGTTAS